MIEFDTLLQEMGRVGRAQRIQLCLLMLPGLFAAMHMGSNVFIGAEIEHWCSYNETSALEQACNRTWTEDQRAMYIPFDQKADSLSQCKRYDLSALNDSTSCEFWWPDDPTDRNATIETVNNSTRQIECETWIFSEEDTFLTTIVSTFGLVCGQHYKRKLSQAFFMCGVAFGATFWGQVSDRKGRKFAIILAGFLAACFSVANTFAFNFYFFLLARVLIGFTVFPPFSSSFVLATELVPPRYRVLVGQACQMAFAVGFCALALVGFLIRDWRTLQFVIAIPLFTTISFYWLMTESPRWLISHKKYARANKIVKNLLRGVGDVKDFREASRLDEVANRDGSRIVRQHKSENYDGKDDVALTKYRYGPQDLLKTPNVRKKSLVLFYCWLTASCGYYGLTLNAADLGGDPFINLLLSGIIEVPACIVSIFLMDKWGRRPTLSLSFVVSGVACVTMQAVKEIVELNIVLSLVGKFGSSAAFATVYIYASEIYATPIRNVGIGICSSCARIGGILAPFIAMLGNLSTPLPYVVFGGLSIVGGFSCLFLPETNGSQLPETMDECENFGRNQVGPIRRIFCCQGEQQRRNDPPIVLKDSKDAYKYEECNRNDVVVVSDEKQPPAPVIDQA